MISSEEYAEELEVVEVDDETTIKTCKMYNYKYSIITPNDIVIPPNNDNLQDRLSGKIFFQRKPMD